MLAKTHIALGYSSCLLITRPSTPFELITCLGISVIFSEISDVDATSSESKKNLAKVTSATAAGILMIFAGDYYLGTNISEHLRNSSYIMRYIIAFIFLLVICIFGEHQPHRSFMHSFAGVAAMCAGTYVIFPSGVKIVLVSMLSHIAADLLNRKKIRLFYPLKKGSFCMNLCNSDGSVNMLLFLLSGTAAIIQTIYLVLGFVGQNFSL